MVCSPPLCYSLCPLRTSLLDGFTQRTLSQKLARPFNPLKSIPFCSMQDIQMVAFSGTLGQRWLVASSPSRHGQKEAYLLAITNGVTCFPRDALGDDYPRLRGRQVQNPNKILKRTPLLDLHCDPCLGVVPRDVARQRAVELHRNSDQTDTPGFLNCLTMDRRLPCLPPPPLSHGDGACVYP